MFRMPVRVPTVERGLLCRMMLCWTAMVGPMPEVLSNLFSSSMPVRMPSERRYCLRPSSKMISKTMLDLPEPLTPVATVRVFLGMVMSMFLRLWRCAPLIVIFFILSPEKYCLSQIILNYF